MRKFNVTGMSCAACSARVEKAVSKVHGVDSCSVNLLTNTMGIEGSASDSEIIKAVVDAGYGASSADEKSSGSINLSSDMEKSDPLKDRETPKLLKRLCVSLFFVLFLMYFSMGHMMWNFPIPSFFNGNPVALGILQMILAAIVMIINQKFFISGFKSLSRLAPNMDTLVSLGSGASFLWSVIVLFRMTDAQINGNPELVSSLMKGFYFESAAMILALITVGKTLEAHSKGKTTNALKSLMKLAPETAIVIKDGKEVEIPSSMLQPGDVFVLKPGMAVPVDGKIVEGSSAIDESALTGESIPADKSSGSKVFSGTMNVSGFVKCIAEKTGSDTAISKIIQMVSDASATKAPVSRIADKVSGIFVPVVIGIAVVTAVLWLLAGADYGFAFERGICVLVISCPCALGLATPVAIMVGNGKGARNGILFKTSESLELTGKAKAIVFDKTGTITKGKPVVTDVVPADGINESLLLKYAFSLEEKSSHPLAKAVCEYVNGKKDAENQKLSESFEILDFKEISGNGLFGRMSDSGKSFVLFAGKADFIREKTGGFSKEMEEKLISFSDEGKTSLLFSVSDESGSKIEKKLLGIIAVSDEIKEEASCTVSALKKLGLSVYMLTGDNEKTAKAVASQAGIDNVIANVLPLEKEKAVRSLKEKLNGNGLVIMVGDGINDAPSLTSADVGMAIGQGTDVAIDAADVVLVNKSLETVVKAIVLSRKTLKNIHENLFWAFFYNVLGIPLAAGAYVSLFGWAMNPMFGAAAMSLSSFCVVSNALRLNFLKFNPLMTENSKQFGEKNQSEKIKESEMTKTLKIEGMMCSHCEAHVKKALEAVDGVTEAVASHEKGTAVVTLSKDVSSELLKKAVEEADYKVISIE